MSSRSSIPNFLQLIKYILIFWFEKLSNIKEYILSFGLVNLNYKDPVE